MIALVASHTLSQLLGQRRSLLMGLLAAIPVLVAVLVRVLAELEEDPREVALGIVGGLVLNLVLPLVALVFGTAAIGQEIEDGTLVYLLTKPIARWKLLVGKVLAAWLATTVVVGVSAAIAGATLLLGRPADLLLPAFVAAVAWGALAYVSLFAALSVRYGRALIIGLVYVFVWEATLSRFAPGTRLFSVRQYTVSIVEALANTPARFLDAQVDTTTAVVMSTAVVLVTGWYGVRLLQRYELRERS
ncbi:MAG: ABC transporter permease [Dehalococcoidia bacterium]